jgi:hypothetical protein
MQKIQVELADQTIKDLNYIAAVADITKASAISSSIHNCRILIEEVIRGGKIYSQRTDGSVVEISLPTLTKR